METTSQDGKRDALVGIFVIIGVSLLVYVVFTNVDLIIDNAFYLIFFAFLLGAGSTIYPSLIQKLKGNKQESDQVEIEDGNAVQNLDLETSDGIELDQ